MDLKAISCRIEWSLFQVHSTKHTRVIIFIINLITKPLQWCFGLKGLNNIVCITMSSLVTYSNCLVIYYRLMLQGSIIKVFLCSVLFNTVSLHTISNDYMWYYTCSIWFLNISCLTFWAYYINLQQIDLKQKF